MGVFLSTLRQCRIHSSPQGDICVSRGRQSAVSEGWWPAYPVAHICLLVANVGLFAGGGWAGPGGWWPTYPVAYICLLLANVGLLNFSTTSINYQAAAPGNPSH